MKIRELPKLFWFSSTVALLSIALAVYLRTSKPVRHEEIGYLLLGAWVLLPPLWFVYEFNEKFPAKNPATGENFERFKHGQDLAKNLWLALIVILGAIIGLKLG